MKKRPLEFIQTRAILAASLPLAFFSLGLCVQLDFSPYFIAILGLLEFSAIAYAVYITQHELRYRLRSLTSVVEGMLQGDFSLKARQELTSSGLSRLVNSINTLSQELSSHKLANIEKRALLEKIITQIEIGVITADEDGNISAINRAATLMLQLEQKTPLKTLQQLPITLPDKPGKALVHLQLGEQFKKLYLQVDRFREFGSDQTLVLITDMNHVLRQEELKSWESLVRVISHEINNSLAPIASLSHSLMDIVNHCDFQQVDAAQAAREDILGSATIIADRAKSLAEFIAQYRSLTHIKPPQCEEISIRTLVNPILPLFIAQNIVLIGDVDLVCALDSTQMKQVLINLLKNAVEAMQHAEAGDASAAITIAVEKIQTSQSCILRIDIVDSGCGIRHNQNLFIPFYTTKAQGSGIGLALSRQIIELHQGSLRIFNREAAQGCCARIELPLMSQQE